MACFLFATNSHDFGKKTYTSCFFSLFCSEIGMIIYSTPIIAIKDLALRWNNKELITGKSVVWFEPISYTKAIST